jgi:S1-C subfamily serine protease
VISTASSKHENEAMITSTLSAFSAELAARTAAGAPAVLQVIGARRPASGVVHGTDTVITTARALGREDDLRVRLPDDSLVDADLAGWDPATGLAVLRTRDSPGLQPPPTAESEPRTGELVLALARSWSNAITASPGIVAVVGGPLNTGRRRQISRVIRITAPVHEGFAGGAVYDTAGRLTGIATAGVIRGFAVAIPASIAWASAAQVLTTGTPSRGFVGLAVQSVELPASQRPEGRERALLVMGVTPESPAAAAGVLVGDLLLDFDDHRTETPDDLLELLTGQRVGHTITARTLRGGAIRETQVTVVKRS